MTRTRVLLAALAVALLVPAAAGATSAPPLHGLWSPVKFVPFSAAQRKKKGSCSEQGRSTRLARLARKVAPVACEQPPRAKLRDATSVVFFGP